MMMNDIDIAQRASIKPIGEIAQKAGIADEYLELYGKTKAKVDYRLLRQKIVWPEYRHQGSDGNGAKMVCGY